jgi:hypothetical protein
MVTERLARSRGRRQMAVIPRFLGDLHRFSTVTECVDRERFGAIRPCLGSKRGLLPNGLGSRPEAWGSLVASTRAARRRPGQLVLHCEHHQARTGSPTRA